jgi:predicted nucleotidyltransferase
VRRAEIEHHVHDFFDAADHGVGAVYLFGSVARDVAGPDSDIDLGILYRISPAPTLDAGPLDLEADLERRLRHPVEVVVLNRAPVDLRARVLRTGRLVFDRDRAARIRFEVRTRNEAFDFEPILRQYRAARESVGD